MNAMSRRMQDPAGLPAGSGASREFVAIDDSGQFSYHRSEQDLLAAFEYVGEAACIIDRSGSAFRLALDSNRHLILGPALGPVEFHWLRHAWRTRKTRTRKGTGSCASTPLPETRWCRACSRPNCSPGPGRQPVTPAAPPHRSMRPATSLPVPAGFSGTAVTTPQRLVLRIRQDRRRSGNGARSRCYRRQ